MGNNIGAGSSKAAKIMKVSGESFKIKAPAKVLDVIKDYPDHVLLDSEEFLRFNLRANPLDPEDEIMPRKIYLLVELPKFPSPLRRVRSGVRETTASSMKAPQRSISDLSILAKSRVSVSDSEDGGSPGMKRVKMRLPKKQVEKIMRESGDQAEIGKRIVKLCLERESGGGGGLGEERESGVEGAVVERRCRSVQSSPRSNYLRKYKRLTSIG